MKILRSVILLVIGCAFLSKAFGGSGYSVSFEEGKRPSKIIELNFEINDYSIEQVNLPEGVFSKINFLGKVTTSKRGYAKLPFIHASIQLNPKDNVLLNIVDSEYVDIMLDHPILPSRGEILRNQNPRDIPYVVSRESIVDSFYPGNITKNSRPFILRDVRGTNIYVYPFQYNAKRKILRVYKSVKVEVLKGRGIPVNPINSISRNILSEMDDIYASIFINYKKRKLITNDFGKILLIHTSRDKEVIKPYILWKKEKGLQVISREVQKGINVKGLIKNEFLNDGSILYVQIVGDWADIKSDLGPSNSPMDPMLGLIVGDDYYADIIVGRFSGNSTNEIEVQISKAINYEKNPSMSGDWYKKAIGIASSEGGPGNGDDDESDQAHMEVIKNERLLKNSYAKVFDGFATGGITSSRIGDYIDSGVGFINYVGHGSETTWVTSGFSNENISNLNNGSMLPFIVSVACVNGAFHKNGESFAEAWLKKVNGGAVAVWMSTINQPWAPPMRGQDYFSDLLIGKYNYDESPGNGINVNSKRTTFGALTYNASYLMYTESDSGSDLDTIKTWTVFGDASLQVRTDKTKKINITNKKIISGVSFKTKILSSEKAIQGLLVSLYHDGVNHTGVTDEFGVVEIAHSFKRGKAKITVTGENSETKSIDSQVVPPNGPYVILSDYIVNDPNGQVDFGEFANFSIKLKNIGSKISGNLSGTIETDSPYVELITPTKFFSFPVTPTKEILLENVFKISFKKIVEDQTPVLFTINLTDESSNEVYQTEIFLKINAPKLTYSFSFKGDQTVNPGDSKKLILDIYNSGHSSILNSLIKINELVGLGITVSPDFQEIKKIKAGEGRKLEFDIFFPATIPVGTLSKIEAVITNEQKTSKFEQDFVIGMTETFESGDFSNINWILEGDATWIINEQAVYNGLYSARSGKVGDREKSSMSLKIDYEKGGSLSFFVHISSEREYDKLKLLQNGTIIGTWSGEVTWRKEFFTIPPGAHTFSWVYEKDGTVSSGEDSAWIDNILASGGVVQN